MSKQRDFPPFFLSQRDPGALLTAKKKKSSKQNQIPLTQGKCRCFLYQLHTHQFTVFPLRFHRFLFSHLPYPNIAIITLTIYFSRPPHLDYSSRIQQAPTRSNSTRVRTCTQNSSIPPSYQTINPPSTAALATRPPIPFLPRRTSRDSRTLRSEIHCDDLPFLNNADQVS